MTLLLLLAACSRSPAPVDQTEGLNEDQRPQRMEAVSAERSERIVLTRYWRDLDGDGYGTPGTSLWATQRPWFYVSVGGDCGRHNPAINPGATEVEADGVDNDCDGATDEVATDTGDTSVTVSGIMVSRDASDGLTYPATILARTPFFRHCSQGELALEMNDKLD